jgi:IS30 family transposase
MEVAGLGCEPLSLGDREEISRGVSAGLSGRAIAGRIGRHYSVVNREIARHGGRRAYRAAAAETAAALRRCRPKLRKLEADPALLAGVNSGLAQGWSPRQISRRLVLDHPDRPELRVSHEALYQALYCQARGTLRVKLTGCLRRGGTRRVSQAERRALATAKSQVIPNMVLITERPAEAADRAVPGHREGDLIMGAANRSAIITLVERTTRYVILQRVPYDHSPGTKAARWPTTPASVWPPASPCSSATPTAPGSAARMKTPTDCCASTSPKAPTCRFTAKPTSTTSHSYSTTGPARPSDS